MEMYGEQVQFQTYCTTISSAGDGYGGGDTVGSGGNGGSGTNNYFDGSGHFTGWCWSYTNNW